MKGRKEREEQKKVTDGRGGTEGGKERKKQRHIKTG
jgi:hypothetical protein